MAKEYKFLSKSDLDTICTNSVDIEELDGYMNMYLNAAINEPNRVKKAIRTVNGLNKQIAAAEHELEKQLLEEQKEYAENRTDSYEDYYKICYKRLASRKAFLISEVEE